MDKKSKPISIDVTSTNFYNKVDEEIYADLALMKKNVDSMIQLRLSAAELVVETAALYHAELFLRIEELKYIANEAKEDTQVKTIT